MMLPVFEAVGDVLENLGEYEFTVAPARFDKLEITVNGAPIWMTVIRIEHRVTNLLGVRLENRLLTTLVVVERTVME